MEIVVVADDNTCEATVLEDCTMPLLDVGTTILRCELWEIPLDCRLRGGEIEAELPCEAEDTNEKTGDVDRRDGVPLCGFPGS